MRNKLLILAVAATMIIAIIHGNFNQDTRTLFIQTSYDPPETVEEPLDGDAKKIVEILESQTEVIEINDTYYGGSWIDVKGEDGSSVHYNVFSDKMGRAVHDSNDNQIEIKWYKFSEEEFNEIQTLIEKLPKHRS